MRVRFSTACRGAAVAVALLLTISGTAQAAPPAGFQQTTVFSGLTAPTVVRFAPDGRVFVAEQSGLIKVYDNLSDPTASIFADLRPKVHAFWDRGLLGMALDPQFPTRPYVYVAYAHDAAIGGTAPRWGDTCPTPPGATADGCVISGHLSKLTASGNVMTSEQVLIEDWCQQYPSHSVGSLEFDAAGALYMSAGDGASFNFGDYGQDGSPLNPCGDPPTGVGGTQTIPTAEGGALRSQDMRTSGDPQTLDGSVIRVDPDTGAGLPANPLFGSTDPNVRRVVAYGLRNPFRFTFRPGTRELWIGDVGWTRWEEINRLPDPLVAPVLNFGWPCREGPEEEGSYRDLNICAGLRAQPSAATAPYYTYFHSDRVVPGESCPTGSSSISGIEFYNGGSFPPAYDGALFFADYSRNCLWVMFRGANGLPNPSNIATFDAAAAGPVNLEVGPGGDLFYPDLNGGTVRRIRYLDANHPPEAVATATPTSGAPPLAVQFDGRGSSDSDAGDTLSFAWDLDGDGDFDDSTSSTPTRTYTTAGTTNVRLQVTDSRGASDVSDPIVIRTDSNTAPTATIGSPSATTTWKVGDTINFSGSATDAQDGSLGAAALSWQLTLVHCAPTDPSSCHTHQIQTFTGVSSGSFTAPDHEYPSHLELTLTATDSGGLTDRKTLRLDPKTVQLGFASSPSGLELTVGGTTGTAPFSRTVIQGSTNSISAASPQTLGTDTWLFGSWSDGGARTHDIVAGETAATYTATFARDTSAPPPGLVAGFGFDEAAGLTVGDRSGNGNSGTILGATRSLQGRFGGALSFDGVDDWVSVADSASLDLTSAMTLEAWVRPSAGGSSWRTVLLKEQPNQLAYALYGNEGTGRPSGHVFVGGDRDVRGAAGSVPLNAWTHLAAVYGGGSLRIFVNGTQAATLALSGNIATSASPLRIGGNAVWPEWFAGLIDEVRIYNRQLTQTEIQTDMNTPVSP